MVVSEGEESKGEKKEIDNKFKQWSKKRNITD
jgi:hypothetical protein